MGDRYHNIYDDGAVLFWTSSIVEWLPVLRSEKVALLFVEVLQECREAFGTRVYGWCIMPEHIHLITQSGRGHDAQQFCAQLLSRFSRRLALMCADAARAGNDTAARWLNVFRGSARGRRQVRVWKERGRGIPIEGMEHLLEKLAYIHNNPVRRGLSATPEQWPFSSARWYAGLGGLVELDQFDL